MKSFGKKFSTLALILAMAPTATATITYSGQVNPDPYTPGYQLLIGNSAHGSVILHNGDTLDVTYGVFVGHESSGNGTLELDGNANLTSTNLQNGTHGSGLVVLSNGAKMSLSQGVWQAVSSGSQGQLYLNWLQYRI